MPGMKPTTLAFPVLLALLPGCLSHEAARNQVRITELKMGMSESELASKLGPPKRTEAMKADGRDRVIHWYQTGRLDETPVVLENGKVVGWGHAATK